MKILISLWNGCSLMEPYVPHKGKKENCCGCGACLALCAMAQRDMPRQGSLPGCYACKHNNSVVLLRSSSGGAFTAISDLVLTKGCVIYGAVLDAQYLVVHSRAVNMQERDHMCGSKYVQSDMRQVYGQIASDLRVGRPVLFSGTGCQVAGVHNYFSEFPQANILYTCDIMCYGIPSSLIWRNYMRLLKEQYGLPAQLSFRSKKLP